MMAWTERSLAIREGLVAGGVDPLLALYAAPVSAWRGANKPVEEIVAESLPGLGAGPDAEEMAQFVAASDLAYCRWLRSRGLGPFDNMPEIPEPGHEEDGS